MKKTFLAFVIVVFCFLMLPRVYAGDVIIQPSQQYSAQIALGDSAVIYVLFPTEYDTWYISETLPTIGGSDGIPLRSTSRLGDDNLYVVARPDTIADSTYTTKKIALSTCPLVYDANTETYRTIADTAFIELGSNYADTSATADTLTFTPETLYGSNLSSKLWPASGFALTVENASSAMCSVTVWIYGQVWRNK